MTPTAGSDPELDAAVAATRRSRLAKAGLAGPYAGADSAAGREAWARAREGRGTYLYGPPGTGKTWAAACCVRLALRDGASARLVTAAALLDEVRAAYDGDRSALRRAARLDLLALDDLGAERPTEWAVETLTRLVDERCFAGLPTVVTSNLALGGVRDLWGGMAGARVASRLAGACERVAMGGPDRRLA